MTHFPELGEMGAGQLAVFRTRYKKCGIIYK
jgi:hypothetical protein